ncbi:MAG: SusC/RagA family TonB-linked outer membrane protein [Gemmatimonadales bacterium]
MTRSLHRALACVGLLLGFGPAAAMAQRTTITGRVLNEVNAPLDAASVAVGALNIVVSTNAEGRFTVVIPSVQRGRTITVTARRLGYQPKSIAIALNNDTMTQDFQLDPAPIQLTGVVTTALGISKEKSQVGTAQQQISSEELNTTFAPNIENQLEGKVSGVTIVGNGTQGGSTSINIRGYTSITGSNQPLFIVDGIPVSNADRGSSAQSGGMLGSHDFGNAIQDINPDDIASISVLKGPNAAALYGSRAANGAIIITTKRGAPGASNMQVSTSYTLDKASILPDFQNSYGQGSGGQFNWVNGSGPLDGNDQSYGPRLNGQLIDQFTGKQMPWVAHPDNVSSFFNTGHTMDGTVAVSGGNDHSNARLSFSGENTSGIVPDQFLRRLGGVASGELSVNDRLTLNGSVNYGRNGATNRPGQGYTASVVEGLYVWFGRQVDMNALKQNYLQSATLNNGPSNREFNWNYSYHNNPYWWQLQNPESDTRDRVIASGSASYKLTDWLNATLRSGTDTYRYNINTDYAEGNIELNNGSTAVNPAYAGAFTLVGDTYSENNTDVLLVANRDLNSHLAVNGTFGGNRRYSTFNENTVAVNGITVPGIYNVANAALSPVNGQSVSNQGVNSTYGSASFTWNGWWTVEGTARNDWSSTLPKGNNSYFYPSVNTSIVLSDVLPSLRVGPISYLKVRGGTARAGNDAAPYSLYTTYNGSASKFDGQSLFSLGNSLLNPDLKPETTTSNEAGLELGLWGSRVSVDASVYDKYTTDEITNVAIPSSSGYSNKLVNAGKIDNKGYEALVTIEPVHNNKWDWSTTFNASHNRGEVVSLNPGLSAISFGGFQGSVRVEARVGKPFGNISGFDIKRDSATGLPLLTDAGTYQATDTMVTLGNIQPSWTGGWVNSVRYKRFTLASTLDVRHGGSIFSGTNFYGQATGTLASTMLGREKDWNNPGVVINGLIESTGQKNTQNISSETYFQSLSYSGIASPYVYDDSFIKLRELRLGYELPPTMAAKFNASAVNIALVGRNLWTSTNVPNIDPEISYNTGSNQGLEYAGLPVPRSYGFSVRVTP